MTSFDIWYSFNKQRKMDIDFKEVYRNVRPLVIKDGKNDLAIGTGLFVVFALLAWKGDSWDFAYVGLGLLVLFTIKAIYVRKKLPVIFETTVKAKRMVLYSRNRSVGSLPATESYDYFLQFTVHEVGTFDQTGIREQRTAGEAEFQIWDQVKFDLYSENDKVYVFTSAPGTLLAIMKEGVIVTFP